MARASTASNERGPFRIWTVRLLKIGVVTALLTLMVLGIFVAVARGEIDSFEDLKASPNGQMIRIRAADGSVIQSLGPSFGRWLTIRNPPPLATRMSRKKFCAGIISQRGLAVSSKPSSWACGTTRSKRWSPSTRHRSSACS